MAKAKTPAKLKSAPTEPVDVVVSYDLFDLPTAFHKAGLAGLILLAMAAPVMADSIANALKAGLDMSQTLSQGGTHG